MVKLRVCFKSFSEMKRVIALAQQGWVCCTGPGGLRAVVAEAEDAVSGQRSGGGRGEGS